MWTVTLVLLLLTGCATFRGTTHPTVQPWRRVTTANFVVMTDLEEQHAVEAASELERTRAALLAALAKLEVPDLVRVRVFVLKSEADFRGLFENQRAALFDTGKRPAFYLLGPAANWSTRDNGQNPSALIVRHAMAHQLADAIFRRAPAWFHEGLAQFLETVRIAEDGQSVVVGTSQANKLASLRSMPYIPLDKTLRWSHGSTGFRNTWETEWNATSWLFFHWLYNKKGETLSAFQQALAKGDDPDAAWMSAYPDFDAADVAPIIAQYAGRDLPVVTRPLAGSKPGVSIELMGESEVHAVRGEILLTAGNRGATGTGRLLIEGRREVRMSMAVDPTNIDALTLDTWTSAGDRLALVRRAVAAHPHDGTALALLARLSHNPEEEDLLLDRAIQASPDDPYVLSDLARYLLSQKRKQRARTASARALSRAPYDPAVIDTYAEALVRNDRCAEAIAEEERALLRSREGGSLLFTQLTERLGEFTASCQAPLSDREVAQNRANTESRSAIATPTRGAEVAVHRANAESRSASSAPTGGAEVEKGQQGVTSYIGVSLGFSHAWATYQSTRPIGESSLTSVGIDLSGRLGLRPLPMLAAAIEGGLLAHPEFGSQSTPSEPNTQFDDLLLYRIGVLVDAELGPPFHLEGGAALISGTWSGRVYGPFTVYPVTVDNSGAYFHAALAARWAVSSVQMGPALRFYYATLSSDQNEASLAGLGLSCNLVF